MRLKPQDRAELAQAAGSIVRRALTCRAGLGLLGAKSVADLDPTWLAARTDVTVRGARAGQHTLGLCAFGAITVYVSPSTDAAEITATTLHEAVHIIEMERRQAGRPTDAQEHGPLFHAMLTILAAELWQCPLTITDTRELESWLRRLQDRTRILLQPRESDHAHP